MKWLRRWAAVGHGAMVTTEYVLVELGNHFRAPTDRELFLEIAEMLRDDARTTLAPASPELLDAGLALYAERREWKHVPSGSGKFADMGEVSACDGAQLGRQ